MSCCGIRALASRSRLATGGRIGLFILVCECVSVWVCGCATREVGRRRPAAPLATGVSAKRGRRRPAAPQENG